MCRGIFPTICCGASQNGGVVQVNFYSLFVDQKTVSRRLTNAASA